MGFRDSRLGKILDVFSSFGKSFSAWLKTVDDDSLTVAEAVKAVNAEIGDEEDTIGDNGVKAMGIAAELNAKEADGIFDREDTVGPVFSVAEGRGKDDEEDPTIALNQALEDETMKYVNGHPVELQPVDPAKLEKGGKESSHRGRYYFLKQTRIQ